MSTPSSRDGVILPEPLAYFLTWTTYGTWLRGDNRGWTKLHQGFQTPDWRIEQEDRRKLKEPPCVLSTEQRAIDETTIRRHCELRSWALIAVNCQSDHVHVVVEASASATEVMNQFKSWCTRRLKEYAAGTVSASELRQRWWTEGGSKRYVNDQASLEAAVIYVCECQ